MGDSLSKDGNVGYKLRLLHNQIHNRMEYQKAQNELERGDLTRMQRFTIGYMYRNRDRDIYQRDLEAEFAISRATASNMLSVMERKGLIRREAVEHDARLKKLVLTEVSMRMNQRIEQDIRETEALLTSGLSEEDKQKLHQYLDIMIQNLVGADGACTTRCCGNDTK
ncbi:MAG: winged helix-turn-helix transcriptional regulator [Lachnospiraceae bacterium]|nr:winged helix-turn-helix transcriptional regulator [Lachnospiraceae bacterium]